MIVNGHDIRPHANLSGVNLTGADLYAADLRSANLTGANLTGADLRSANLSGAFLTGANLTGANLSGVNLTGAVGILRIGPTFDGYEFFAVIRDGVPWVKAGCMWFTLKNARKHWRETRGGTTLGDERLAFCTLVSAWARLQKGDPS